jgi:hypothetical protein
MMSGRGPGKHVVPPGGPAGGHATATRRFARSQHATDDWAAELHDCLIRRIAMGDQPTHLSSPTLLFGTHASSDSRWPRAIYGTAALSEWRDDSAFFFPMKTRPRRPSEFKIEFRDPVRDVVVVPGAELTFTGDLTTSSSNGAHDFRACTTAVMKVEVKRPLRISDFTTKHVQPLRALMALAADRPDDLIRETYVDPATRQQAEVWRRGRTISEAAWTYRHLFAADALFD